MRRKGKRENGDGVNRGPWSPQEDTILINHVQLHGQGKWSHLSKTAGLNRTGKSCRLRWLNYLKPDIKRGNISSDEEDLIIRLHNLLGNRWSLIAGRLPGRTDNEIKNHWNTHLRKKIHNYNHSNQVPNKLTLPSTDNNSFGIIHPTLSNHELNHSVNTANNVISTTCCSDDLHNCSSAFSKQLDICNPPIIPYEDFGVGDELFYLLDSIDLFPPDFDSFIRF